MGLKSSMSCPYRKLITSLSIFWCRRYHIPIDIEGYGICYSCLNRGPARRVLEERLVLFEDCWKRVGPDHVCPVFDAYTTPKKCLACRSDGETRARISLEGRKRLLVKHRKSALRALEEKKTTLEEAYDKARRLLWSPETEREFSLLDRAIEEEKEEIQSEKERLINGD